MNQSSSMQIRPCMPPGQTWLALSGIDNGIHRLLKTTVSGITFPHLAHIPCQHCRVASGSVRRQASTHLSSAGMSLVQVCHHFVLFFSEGIRWAGRQTHKWHIVHVLHSFFYLWVIGSKQTWTDSFFFFFVVTCRQKYDTTHETQQSHVLLAHGLFYLCVCGLCLQWGECKLDLKSDLKVSRSVEEPLPLPLVPRFECRWFKPCAVFEVCQKKGNKKHLRLGYIYIFFKCMNFMTKLSSALSQTNMAPSTKSSATAKRI